MGQTTSKPDLSFLTDSVNLPSLPAVALQVVRMTREPDVELEQVAEVVSHDPALAARMLKLSNSPLFGRSREVSTLDEALMVLGMKTVRLAAISFSLVPLLGSPAEGETFDFRDFWCRSVTSAVVAKTVGEEVAKHVQEEAFICGLLMDVGVPILFKAIPAKYGPMRDHMDAGHPSLVQEEHLIGATHADVAAELLNRWELPELVVDAVCYHHRPNELPEGTDPKTIQVTRILHVAHDVANIMTSPNTRGEGLKNTRQLMADWWDVSDTRVDDLITALSEPVQQMAELMEVDIGEHPEANVILEQAREDLLAITLGTTLELHSAQKQVAELKEEATTDGLTGIKNRAAFDRLLSDEWEKRLDGPETQTLGIVMVDVDHFKSFNDTHGHQTGDEVLRSVAQALARCCRGNDHVCRYGGEEFSVVVSGVTSTQLKAFSERMRRAIEAMAIPSGAGMLKVTASFGGVCITSVRPESQPERAVEIADKNLYVSKETGRNRVTITEIAL